MTLSPGQTVVEKALEHTPLFPSFCAHLLSGRSVPGRVLRAGNVPVSTQTLLSKSWQSHCGHSRPVRKHTHTGRAKNGKDFEENSASMNKGRSVVARLGEGGAGTTSRTHHPHEGLRHTARQDARAYLPGMRLWGAQSAVLLPLSI